MPFYERLTGEITPQRLFVLCKLVASGKYSKKQIFDLIQPLEINKNQDVVVKVYSTAINGELIIEDPDMKVLLNIDVKYLKDMSVFRCLIADKVFSKPDFIFAQFTSWYIARGMKAIVESSNQLAMEFDKEMNLGEGGNKYNEVNIRGWRRWFTFLGLGYSHFMNKSTVCIPNASIRIEDSIKYSLNFMKGEIIPFGIFIKQLSNVCPELDGGKVFMQNKGKAIYPKNHLSTAVSSGLRTLHDQGKITLRYVPDARDIWFLEKVETHEIPYQVSELVIKEDF